jgi:hypothetical protein
VCPLKSFKQYYMSSIQTYENLTPCEFFEKPPVKRCLIRFIQKYGGGSTGALTSVSTTDSATVTWSGNGTSGSPLVATAIAPANTANIPIASTNASGIIVDGSANVITRPLTGFVTDGNTAIVATDTILVAFNKTQGQIDARITLTSPITGFAVGANSTMLAADTLIAALGKVQGQINARITTATVLSAYTVGANTALANTDNIITMLGKIQGQINARALTTAIPAAANPTSTIGTTASNGVATTFMRSDAAPAINQAMTPTWTGVHTFNGTSTIFGNTITASSLAGTGTRNVVVTATGDLQAGAGAQVSNSSPTLTFDPVPANGALDLGFTVTGAAIGDAVALGIPAAAQVNGVVFTAMVSNTDVITVRCHNFTGSPISIPGGVFKAVVFKV